MMKHVLMVSMLICVLKGGKNHELRADDSEVEEAHEYWFNKNAPYYVGDDSLWNYCDEKCLYLERYAPGKDFVVIVFSGFLKDTFSACYVKVNDSYLLWNQVINNPFYQENCGGDYQDWLKDSQFHLVKVYGTGIGTEITDNQIYKDQDTNQ